MDKTAQKKEPLMCYFHFMFNEWNESKAKKVFANASCGCNTYGRNGAVIATDMGYMPL